MRTQVRGHQTSRVRVKGLVDHVTELQDPSLHAFGFYTLADPSKNNDINLEETQEGDLEVCDGDEDSPLLC